MRWKRSERALLILILAGAVLCAALFWFEQNDGKSYAVESERYEPYHVLDVPYREDTAHYMTEEESQPRPPKRIGEEEPYESKE